MTQTAALPAAAASDDTRRAIGCFVLAIFLFAGMDTLIKYLSSGYPVAQLMFARSVVAVVLVGGISVARGGWGGMRTQRPVAHVLRSLAGLLSMGCFFYAFKHLPLAEVYVLSFAGPLFITALSMPLLGEPVGWRRWAAVLVGFGGVVVMARPEADAPLLPILVGVAAAFFYALAMIAVRGLSRTESNTAIVVYLLLTTTVVSGVAAIPDWVQPGGFDLWLMLLVGTLGGAAQVLMTQAFRLGRAAVVAPFEYTGMIWATLLGFLVFGDVPTPTVLAGAGIIIASGLYILYRETRRRGD
ncbi:drug/metabolite transporter (DMT)-like permease [Azospirillum brasilense]|uniref:Drug/metabolite transporter (DMT)-like permease n=1 Tax=Azospirillum brasilense TaxID=192 RepID=A0A560CC59_AZOBR|nr:DMT family transporter [Azospirillum brasilense]TWA82448.1 drug/metabolite transporter (DMT)-like permease [Azospirillum brasilense]